MVLIFIMVAGQIPMVPGMEQPVVPIGKMESEGKINEDTFRSSMITTKSQTTSFGANVTASFNMTKIPEARFESYQMPSTDLVFDIEFENGTFLWFSVLRSSSLYLMDIMNGNVVTFDFDNQTTPFRIKRDKDGSIWFTDYDYTINSMENSIVHFFPQNLSYIRYEVPDGTAPFDLAITENTVWYSEWLGNTIGSINKNTWEMQRHDIGCEVTCGPLGIIVEQDDTIWFVESYTNKLTKFFPSTQTLVKYSLPESLSAPVALAEDSTGVLWTGAHGGNALVSFDRKSARFSEYFVPSPKNVSIPIPGLNDVVVGNKGVIWTVEHFANSLTSVDPKTRTVVQYMTDGKQPEIQWADSFNDSIWFAQFKYGTISSLNQNQMLKVAIAVKSETIFATKGDTIEVEFDLINNSTENMIVDTYASGLQTRLIQGLPERAEILQNQKNTFSVKVNLDNNLKIDTYILFIGVENAQMRITYALTLSIKENALLDLLYYVLPPYVMFALYAVYIRANEKKQFSSNQLPIEKL